MSMEYTGSVGMDTSFEPGKLSPRSERAYQAINAEFDVVFHQLSMACSQAMDMGHMLHGLQLMESFGLKGTAACHMDVTGCYHLRR